MPAFEGETVPTLLSEANHRIANTLASIAGVVRLQARNENRVQRLRNPNEVREFLSEVAARIEMAADLHRQLASSGCDPQLDISGFIHKIAGSTVKANTGQSDAVLHLDLRAKCVLPADQALSIGLIVVELITNALKYAHPTGIGGHIAVSCEQSGEDLVIVVSDDGVGLPEDFDWSDENSLGCRLIRSLTQQLGGQFLLENADIGARATLTVPQTRPHAHLRSVSEAGAA